MHSPIFGAAYRATYGPDIIQFFSVSTTGVNPAAGGLFNPFGEDSICE